MGPAAPLELDDVAADAAEVGFTVAVGVGTPEVRPPISPLDAPEKAGLESPVLLGIGAAVVLAGFSTPSMT